MVLARIFVDSFDANRTLCRLVASSVVPLFLVHQDPQCSRLYIPHLNLDTAASARLPILSMEKEFLGYLPARCIPGLLHLLDGTGRGEMLHQADAAEVGGEARNGQLVTALAFVAGRGKGITTLPLHLKDQDDAAAVIDGDDHGEPSANDDVEPEPAGVVVVGADDLVQEEQHAEAAGQEQEDEAQEEEHAAQDKQAHQLQVVAEAARAAYLRFPVLIESELAADSLPQFGCVLILGAGSAGQCRCLGPAGTGRRAGGCPGSPCRAAGIYVLSFCSC